ncbi:hypothetical protein ACFWPX_12210 [Nocardia sp. NPDC058518]|uniref:hypothetical protein n=1 Tax=Nocardia sp. NPDC058518 TaxID=3346534 RepID=UPI003653135C
MTQDPPAAEGSTGAVTERTSQAITDWLGQKSALFQVVDYPTPRLDLFGFTTEPGSPSEDRVKIVGSLRH